MSDIKIEKLTIKETKVVVGGSRGFSPGGTSGKPSIDVCCCACACIPSGLL